MGGRRQDRFAALLQEEMSDIFHKKGKEAFGNEFISVSRVEVSPDLGHVKFYLSILNEKTPEKLVETIRNHTKELRMALSQRIKNQVKKIPEIEFFYDDTMDYAQRMENLFDQIDTDYPDKDDNEENGDDRNPEQNP